MGPHDQDHETLLVQIVVGDLPRSSPQASQLLANCADCRAKLGELDGLEEQLAAAGRDERADVAQAAVGELDARAQLRLEEFINARLPRRSLLSRRNRLVALALAASLCGLLGYRLIRPSAPGQLASPSVDVPLGQTPVGQEALAGIAPMDKVTRFDPFTWKSPQLRPGETFRLRIWNLDVAAAEPLVLQNLANPYWRREDARQAETARVKEFFDRANGNIEWSVEIWQGNRQVGRGSSPLAASRN